jgi:hypothetical protein
MFWQVGGFSINSAKDNCEKYLSQNFPIQKNIRNLAAQNVKHVGIWQKW